MCFQWSCTVDSSPLKPSHHQVEKEKNKNGTNKMLDVSNPMCFWSTLFHFNVNGRRSEITRSKVEKIMPRTNGESVYKCYMHIITH